MPSLPLAHRSQPTAEQVITLVRAVATELHPRLARAALIDLDTQLETTLGFDSLGRLELIARLERTFDVRLPDQAFSSVETPRDLLLALGNAAGERVKASLDAFSAAVPTNVEAPAAVGTLTEALDWHVTRHGARVHLLHIEQEGNDDEAITYTELRQAARSVAAGLLARGLNAGETVALMLPTGRDYFMSFFGILYAGGIPVPLYPPARPQQLEDHMRRQAGILANAGCTALITVDRAKPLAHLLRLQVATLRAVFVTADLSAGDPIGLPLPKPDDIAFLQYTSGSTGDPKGVMLTHANLLANIRADGRVIEASASDVFVSWLPLYHDMGLIGAWLGSLYFGARLVIMSPLAFLARPERWLHAIHRYGGTLSAAPNFAYGLCVSRIDDRDIEGLDLSRWRLTLNGAEAISPDTLQAFEERFARYGFHPDAMYPVYGLAECSVGLTFPPLHRRPLIDQIDRQRFARTGQAVPIDGDQALRFVACGRPLPDHEVRVIDANHHELPERREGRLQFRGPSATQGYYHNEAATERLFDGEWLETGDRAYIAAGDLYITGRSKDMIIRAGRNIHPQELEEAIGELADVRTGRVAVFADRDPGEDTDHLIVLAETHLQDDEEKAELIARISQLTTDLTWSAADEIVLAPPGTVLKTSSGKIRRAASREIWRNGLVGRSQSALWWQGLRLTLSAIPGLLARTGRGLASRVYGIYARGVFYIVATLSYLSALALPRPWRWPAQRFLGRTLALTTGIGLKIRGGENLPDPGTPCIFVANHASYIDSYVIAVALPRNLSFVAKSELRESALSRSYLDRLGTIYVTRGDIQQSAADVATTTHAAGAGRSLVFFPEGTFARPPGLLSFHMGAFMTAAEAQLPVIPVAIKGTRNILRPESWLPRRGDITVTIGAPLEAVSPNLSENTWQQALLLRDHARRHIRQYCGEPELGS